ncbi:MAG TPA: VacJ family lipoprotein [Woeseiaceae bacterium]|nr:VacJ family lipoprotein [Woeseiaceae bacterium]
MQTSSAGRGSLILAIVLLLGGCATQQSTRVSYDPWEPLNRALFEVNDVGDHYVLKPVAKGYKWLLPSFIRRGVTNFSQNLTAPGSAINHFLQGKPKSGFGELTRFLFNSTIGIGGLIDVSAHAGLERDEEDFGQTFAVWGAPAGPYVVIPFLGPRTLRDALAIPLNFLADPLWHYDVKSVRNPLYVLRLINLRANLLSAEAFIKDSKDPYVTIRESYLQNRNYQIYDGDPPIDDDFYDGFEDDFQDDEESAPDDATN